MILKDSSGLSQLEQCPQCMYLVKASDMFYENGQPLKCVFCTRRWVGPWSESKYAQPEEAAK